MSYLDFYKSRFEITYGDAYSKTNAEEQKQFLLFLKNYPNTFSLTYENKSFQAAIISEKDSILQETYYLLLTEISNSIGRGSLISDAGNTKWLVFNNAKNGISAYNRYKILLCDKIIKWIDEYGNNCESPCYMQGTQKGSVSTGLAGSLVKIPEPNGTLLVVIPQENFRRGKRFIIEDQAWKVVGFDSVSFPGICFLSLLEDIVDEQNDNLETDIALNKIDQYKIQMITDSYIAAVAEKFDIHYQVFKNGAPINESCSITLNNTNATISGNTITCVSVGTTIATVTLLSNPEIKGTCNITIEETRVLDNEHGVIIGADTIKWGRTQTYAPTLYKNGVPEATTFTVNITDEQELITWTKVGSLINITAKTVNITGSITLEVVFANNLSVTKTIDIISLWG